MKRNEVVLVGLGTTASPLCQDNPMWNCHMPSGPLCHFTYNNLRSIRLSPRFFLLGPKGVVSFLPKVEWVYALEGRGVALGCKSMAAPLLAIYEVGITTARVLVVRLETSLAQHVPSCRHRQYRHSGVSVVPIASTAAEQNPARAQHSEREWIGRGHTSRARDKWRE